jgi:hypothetical protein
MSNFFAYGQENAALEIVMRLHSVKRWHMIDTTRNQTLAEHTANVSLLAYTIAYTIGYPTFSHPSMIAMMGLFHDLGETVIGDIPTHTKQALGGARKHIDALESSVLPTMFNYTDITAGPLPWRLLVKVCDLADGIRFIRLHGVDVTARHAKEGLEAQLKERFEEAKEHWPEKDHVVVARMIHFYAYELS